MCIEDGELIDLLNHRIVEIYETQGITPLRGFDESYLLPNGKQFLILTHNVFEAVIDIRQTKNIIDDLCFLSEEITFFTAMLYLYQPFVEKPLNNPILIGNKT
ncbi:MAG: hypothetical protein LBR66_00940, partial [Candidatus Symbiothrix sp.]|nr:hypothetical protein [Candidatus Symbiothrix sp.]